MSKTSLLKRYSPLSYVYPSSMLAFLSQFRRIALSFFSPTANTGENVVEAYGLVVVVLGLLFFESFLLVSFSEASRNFNTALQQKDQDKFWEGVYAYMRLLSIGAPFYALSDYGANRLKMKWREFLTKRLLGEYFNSKAAMYRVHQQPCSDDLHNYNHDVDRSDSSTGTGIGEQQRVVPYNELPPRDDSNDGESFDADARILLDASAIASLSVSLMSRFILNVVNFFSFCAILWRKDARLAVFAVVYSAIASVIADVFFGSRLQTLLASNTTKEALLRSHLLRCKQHREEITMYQGSVLELGTSLSLFDSALRNSEALIFWEGLLAGYNNAFSFLSALVPYTMMAPLYFEGHLEFGDITQAGMAFRVIQGALSMMVQQQTQIAALKSSVTRIATLEARLRRADEGWDREHRLMRTEKIAKEKTAVDDDREGKYEDGKDTVEKETRGTKEMTAGVGIGAGAKVMVEDGTVRLLEKEDRIQAEEGGVVYLPRPHLVPLPTQVDLSSFSPSSSSLSSSSTLVSSLSSSLSLPVVLSLRGVSLRMDGRLLLSGLHLDLHGGQRLLVRGPSGCGKSLLLRVLAGITTRGACGSVFVTSGRFFVPQQPYLSWKTEDRLQQLAYPSFKAADAQEIVSHVAAAAAAADADTAGGGGKREGEGAKADELKGSVAWAVAKGCRLITRILAGMTAYARHVVSSLVPWPLFTSSRSALASASSSVAAASASLSSSSSTLALSPVSLSILCNSIRRSPSTSFYSSSSPFTSWSSPFLSRRCMDAGAIAAKEHASAEREGKEAAAATEETDVAFVAEEVLQQAALQGMARGRTLGTAAPGAAGVFNAAQFSVGEKERLMLARLLFYLRTHQEAALVVVDEATAGLDEATEAVVYNNLTCALRKRNVALVSVAHRPGVEKYHDLVLEWTGEGGSWRLRPART